MREKIRNDLYIRCEGVDLTTVSNIEFYVRQKRFFRQYTPTVINAGEMTVEIPYEDAKELMVGAVQLQFAFTREDGTADASGIVAASVSELLKEAGYDPV